MRRKGKTSSCTHAHTDKHTHTHRQMKIYIPHPYFQSGHGWIIYCIVYHLNVISATAMRFFFFLFRGIFVTNQSFWRCSLGSELSSLWYASIINGEHTSPALGSLWIFISPLTPLIQTTVFTVSISHGEEDIMECVHLCMCVCRHCTVTG